MKWVIRIVGGLIAVILLAMGVLYILGHRANAGRISASTELNSSREQIWPWLNDGDKLKKWVSWLVEVRGWEAGSGVGTKRVWVMRDENNGGALMEIEGRCSEYAPPSRLTVQLSSGNLFDGQQAYILTDLGNGRTRLEVEMRYHFSSSFAKLMEPLITSSAEKKMVGDMARLKGLVEGGTAAVK